MAKDIKVIFKEMVAGVAQPGDVKNVSAGFARNYLLPNKYAVVATPPALERLEKERSKWEAQIQQRKEEAQALAEMIKQNPLIIAVKTGENGKLFGSVTSTDVVQFLNEKGVKLDKRVVIVKDLVKTIGKFPVEFRLHPEVNVVLDLEVVPLS